MFTYFDRKAILGKIFQSEINVANNGNLNNYFSRRMLYYEQNS